MESLLRILGEFREQMHHLLSRPASTTSFSVTHLSRAKSESQIKPYTTFHLQLVFLLKSLRHKKTGEQFVLSLDNTLSNNENLELRIVFSNTLHIIYNTDITPRISETSFNNWTADRTKWLVKTFLQNPQPSKIFDCVNSIYFKADWETPFAEILNNVDDFHVSPTESIKIIYMMGNILNIPFAETETFIIVCMPYKNRDVGMYVIFPNKDNKYKYNIRQFVNSMDAKDILSTIEIMKPHDVTVKIPKISLSNKFSILKPRQKYSLFDKLQGESSGTESNATDEFRVPESRSFRAPSYQDISLQSVPSDANLRVSEIVQKMELPINKEGTETAASGGLTDFMGRPKTVALNRPFAFFIRNEETQTMLFWGTISNPSKN